MDQKELEPRQDPNCGMCRELSPTQMKQMKLWSQRYCKDPEKIYKHVRVRNKYQRIRIETLSQLTASMSDVRPTSWQKASSGAVRKNVNWLPLAAISGEDTDDGFSGERSKAADSPLSAPCSTCIFNK